MTGAGLSTVDELSPADTFETLKASGSAAMIDVRTRAEWVFTGLPDVSATGKPIWPVEWVTFPEMAPNALFMDQLLERSGGDLPERLFFICRSGARSMSAARHVASLAGDRPVHCTNVAEGFEGDVDVEGHRGSLNGWKARGLPWRQN